jgi:Spy/CpxP family protein refolding chaperone
VPGGPAGRPVWRPVRTENRWILWAASDVPPGVGAEVTEVEVGRRRATQALSVAAFGLASALLPAAGALAASSVASHQPPTHHGGAPQHGVVSHGVLCRDLNAQQASQSHLGLALASALRSGRVDQSKRGMLRVLEADLKKEGTAQKALRDSPSKVRAAENHLVSDVERVKAAVSRATKISQLLGAFASFGHDTHMAGDGVTLANWYRAQCLTPHIPSAHPGAPGSSSGTPGTPGGSP